MNSSRRPLIAGNWKCFLGGASGVALATDVVKLAASVAARRLAHRASIHCPGGMCSRVRHGQGCCCRSEPLPEGLGRIHR